VARYPKTQWVESRLRIFHQHDVFASLSAGLVRAIMDEAYRQPYDNVRNCAIVMDATTFGTMHEREKFVTPKVCGFKLEGMRFLSGRERDQNIRAIVYQWRKLRGNLKGVAQTRNR
jgi:hypothetical protein